MPSGKDADGNVTYEMVDIRPLREVTRGMEMALENWFTYHTPTPAQVEQYHILREMEEQLELEREPYRESELPSDEICGAVVLGWDAYDIIRSW